jgi:hypothetical protein
MTLASIRQFTDSTKQLICISERSTPLVCLKGSMCSICWLVASRELVGSSGNASDICLTLKLTPIDSGKAKNEKGHNSQRKSTKKRKFFDLWLQS